MPGNAEHYRSRYRGQRNRSGARQPQMQSDALVAALTVQVLVIILLLLAANIMKKAESPVYARARSQYDVMVTDTSQTREAMDYLVGQENLLSGFFTAVEDVINDVISRFGITAPAPSAVEQEPVWEADFAYDYLNPESIQSMAALGQGGEFPVVVANSAGLPAPEGSVLSPVYLTAKLRPPVTGVVTSPFAYRYHPISGFTDFHTGMDIAAPEGTAILAALPGEVVEVDESDIYGLYAIVEHSPNLRTFYAHCSELIAGEGMRVRQGERIAKVGQTGTATGPHLHFSVIVEGQFTDPAWVLGDNIRLVE